MKRSPSSAPRTLHESEAPALRAKPTPVVVVDCSVMGAILWVEPAAGDALAQLAVRSPHASALLRCELANVARNKHRSGVPPADARAGLEAFAQQQTVLHETQLCTSFNLAHRHALTAYDAAYLALALKLHAPLVTFDHKLASAARALRSAG